MSRPIFLRLNRASEMLGIKQFQLDQVIFGTAADSSVVLDGAGVAEMHCMIERRGEELHLIDLGSGQPTLHKGVGITDVALAASDEFTIGDYRIEVALGLPKFQTAPAPAATAVVSVAPPPPPPPPPPAAGAATVAKPTPPLTPVVAAPQALTPPASTTPPPATQIIVPRPVPVTPKETVKPAPPPAQVAAPTQQKPPTPAPLPSAPARPAAAVSAGMDTVDKQPRRAKGTYAPTNRDPQIENVLKPGKGSGIEVVVVWQKRIINSYAFSEKREVSLGTHPDADIFLPVMDSAQVRMPLLKIEAATQVYFTGQTQGEIIRQGSTSNLQTLIAQGKAQKSGSLYFVQMQQDEMVRLDLGHQIQIYIRYAPLPPKPMAVPLFNLSSEELVGLLGSAVFSGLLALVVSFSAPTPEEEELEDPLQPTRKAVFVYKKKEQAQVSAPEVGGSPQPSEKVADQKATPIPNLENKPPAEAKPNPSQSQEVKLTGTNTGKTGTQSTSKNTNKNQSATPKKAEVDVKNVGILSVFGRQGTQNELSKVLSGAEAVGGIGRGAGGKAGSGMGDNSSATEPGLKSMGKGGQGTATVGISGVRTKGLGGGVSGYGEESLGGKKSAQIVAGGVEEAFTGSIDKEAIRRVIISKLGELKACYNRSLNRSPGLEGKIVLEWLIGNGGRVLEARVKTTTMNNPEVEQCCVNRLKGWRFPDPPAGQEAQVAYPFVFAP
ncbi:MAG: AgmX/PglI C-terminal domain-containing protein [Bdellovibrionales bacterium]|nr:AgmX/PglI C-terminal domain-containing protein [Bdellovibrionales bacterium]